MIRKTIVFSLFLVALSAAWNLFAPENMRSSSIYFSIAYFAISNTLIHSRLIKINENSPQQFIRVYIGSTALRLFMNLIVILVYILIDKAHAMTFAISFLLLYFVFLIFEIANLQHDLKKK